VARGAQGQPAVFVPATMLERTNVVCLNTAMAAAAGAAACGELQGLDLNCA
jgi:hypothetical protein